MKDNRNYKFSKKSVSRREEYLVIERLIKKGSKIIDLGSGDGSLLKLLIDKKKVNAIGVEISPSGVAAAQNRKVKTIVGRIDERLPFKNKQFDYAICNVTLQMVMYPEVLLKEMVRISNYQIVTFPNFAFILNRLELLLRGVMPRVMIPGYEWFSTGHIHQLSIKDFHEYCKTSKIRVLKTPHIGPTKFIFIPNFMLKAFPNLFATTGIFLTSDK